MATFILIAGAWHGGWSWRTVRKGLMTLGHDVFTPSLTGLGERRHLASPAVDLDTHLDDVANLIIAEELSDVVLCGHSYGGVVIRGVADRLAGRIRAMVFLDAMVLTDGQCVYDVMPPETVGPQLNAARQLGGWLVPPAPAAMYNVNAADFAWVDRHCVPHPLACFQQKLRLTGAHRAVTNLSYIYATDWPGAPHLAPFYEMAKAAGWRTGEIACGHDVMVDQPARVIEALLMAAQVG